MPGSTTGLLKDEANELLASLMSRYNPSSGLGHMSPSIYDTAWVSMITKANEWLFPAAFQYLLDHQHPSGGWESSSETDSILHTLSALLSMKLHSYGDATLSDRLQRAQSYLATRLNAWDISTVERVGFEIAVPSLLSLLAEQGIDFSFPGRSQLMELNSAKLSKLVPELIYKHQTSILHSLEGLIGHLDFDKLAHHKRNGSFMASPSSTAAYLMYASVWDDECEAYLTEVLSRDGNGSVPCAWPTTFFELSWIVCNLHDGGFDFSNLDQVTMLKIRDILAAGIEAGNGVVGFAQGPVEDADDSAKVPTALNYLGVHKSVTPLCDAFELESHFRCFPYERNASITVQCNVLIALVEAAVSRPSKNGTQAANFDEKQLSEPIIKTARFISEAWWATNSQILDKWHASPYYPMLLIAQSLSKFLMLFNQGHIAEAPEIIVQTKAPITLFQILIRILQGQRADGSWGSCEETAFALLALSNLASLPFISVMHDTIQMAVLSGRDFLQLNLTGKQGTDEEICLWTGKVNHRNPLISYSYGLAALRATAAPIPDSSKSGELDRLILIPAKRVQGFLHFYRKLPLFQDCKDWQLLAYIAEGYLYIPILEDVRKAVFGREGMGEDRYMEYTPFSWTSASSRTNNYSCPQNSFVLMAFLVDEFFDSMVQDHGKAVLPTLRQAIDEIFDALDNNQSIANFDCGDGPFSAMVRYIHKFTCFIVGYPTLQNASDYDKAQMRRELKAYLLAMTQQTEDNTIKGPGRRFFIPNLPT
ncbi:Ent-kaurene synthase [Mycena sanguinolenta]|uniref:Ent-kaurene synthase n=1 Tax=Mycena sanguinolenta TaxID=230812 RepID=A0A8H6ZA65_9AGAR|nr:Ent-kaurene synthase [Mycena sanguinolenta]